MSVNTGAARPGWQRALARAATVVQVVMCTAALLTVSGALTGSGGAGSGAGSMAWAVTGRTPTVAWTAEFAQRFPDCAPGLGLALPGSVIEVGSAGVPVRIGFSEAWRRTHDRVAGNSGRIVAQCRDGVG